MRSHLALTKCHAQFEIAKPIRSLGIISLELSPLFLNVQLCHDNQQRTEQNFNLRTVKQIWNTLLHKTVLMFKSCILNYCSFQQVFGRDFCVTSLSDVMARSRGRQTSHPLRLLLSVTICLRPLSVGNSNGSFGKWLGFSHLKFESKKPFVFPCFEKETRIEIHRSFRACRHIFILGTDVWIGSLLGGSTLLIYYPSWRFEQRCPKRDVVYEHTHTCNWKEQFMSITSNKCSRFKSI